MRTSFLSSAAALIVGLAAAPAAAQAPELAPPAPPAVPAAPAGTVLPAEPAVPALLPLTFPRSFPLPAAPQVAPAAPRTAAPNAIRPRRTRLAVRGDGLTAIGAAAFDGTRSAIELPFAGRAPRAFLYRLSPTHYYYEFEGARFAPGGAQYHKLGSNLERFTLADRPGRPVVRLSFRLTRATVPAVRVDAATRTIKVLPLGREASLGSAPAIVPHGWSLPVEKATDRLTASR